MVRLASIFIVVALSSGAIAKTSTEPVPVPKITIDYPGVIEFNCKALGLKTGDPSMVVELRERLPAWRAAWGKDGPRLLAALRNTVGKPWRAAQHELSVDPGCPEVAYRRYLRRQG
jgi:hypothetical protein